MPPNNQSEFPASVVPETVQYINFIVSEEEDDEIISIPGSNYEEVVDDEAEYEEDGDNDDATEDDDFIENTSILGFKTDDYEFLCAYDINSDGSLVVIGYYGRVVVWDTAKEQIILELKERDDLCDVCFSDDSKYLAMRYRWHLEVWEIGVKTRIFQFVTDECNRIIWHSISCKLFGIFYSGEIYMWEMPQGKCLLFPVNESPCRCVELSPNGALLAAGYDDGGVRVWDIQSGAIVSQLCGLINDNSESISKLCFSCDGQLLLAHRGYNEPLVLKTDICDIIVAIEYSEDKHIDFAEFCPDPTSVIITTGSNYCGEIKLWIFIADHLQLYRKVNLDMHINSFCWNSSDMFLVSDRTAIYMVNQYTGEKVKYLRAKNLSIMNFALLKDKQKILVSFYFDSNSDMKLYNVETGFLSIVP